MAKKSIRPIRVEGNFAYITLTQGYEAVIDATDVPLVSGFNWKADVRKRRNGSIQSVYAKRTCNRINGKQPSCWMHRTIMSDPPDVVVDHINSDCLDNRRANLRIATHAENMRNQRIRPNNTSGIKGVSWHQARKKWTARIWVNNKCVYLGIFETIASAASSYEEASHRLHGEFAKRG